MTLAYLHNIAQRLVVHHVEGFFVTARFLGKLFHGYDSMKKIG